MLSIAAGSLPPFLDTLPSNAGIRPIGSGSPSSRFLEMGFDADCVQH